MIFQLSIQNLLCDYLLIKYKSLPSNDGSINGNENGIHNDGDDNGKINGNGNDGVRNGNGNGQGKPSILVYLNVC